MRMCGRSTSTSRTSKAERESRLPVITAEVEDLLRRLAPQVLGAVVRRYGNFDLAEDATQEAMAAAAMQWPRDGLPENPRAWLITVASRRLTDLLRSEQTRRQREDTVARWTLTERGAPRPDEPPAGDTDDTLRGSRSSPPRFPAGRPGRTSSRRRSRPSTMRRRAPR